MEDYKIEIHHSIVEFFPGIEDCESAREISQTVFGVSSLSHLLASSDMEGVERVKEFFKGNTSGLVEWAKYADRVSWSISLAPAHTKAYNRILKDLGQELATHLSLDRNFADTAPGYLWLTQNKKAMKRFSSVVLPALSMFPPKVRAVIVHDYIVKQMKNAENRGLKKDGKTIPVITLPQPTFAEPPSTGALQILIPGNTSDLRRIGNAQGHCVGTKDMGYADKVRRGEVFIFAVFKDNLSDGVCVEMDKTGLIKQVQGKHRRAATRQEEHVIVNIRACLIGAKQLELVA